MWRTLYRADGLYRLTPADVVALEPLGLHTVIDLRSAPELDERGRFPVDAHPVVFHHLPIVDKTWAQGDAPEYDRDEDFLIWAYQDMLAVGAPRFAEGLRGVGRARRAARRVPLRRRQGPHRSARCAVARRHSASRTTTSSPTTP